MRTLVCLSAALAVTAATSPAAAWGDLGHEVVAKIAYRHLAPAAKAKLDALLASDTDPLTAPDIASRATWADKYRTSPRETGALALRRHRDRKPQPLVSLLRLSAG